MQAAVEEREQAHQTAVLDEPEYPAPAAQRSDGQAAEQQDERGQPGAVGDALHRIRAQGSGKSALARATPAAAGRRSRPLA